MKKKIITIDIPYDFYLIGIVSPAKDYRISSLINKNVMINLTKLEDLISSKKISKTEKKDIFYSKYHYRDEVSRTDYYLIANKSAGECLIPDRNQVDYFFMINGNQNVIDNSNILQKIKTVSLVQTAFEIDIRQLKSKQNLIFE